jgi:hypothetical protein
MPAPCVPVGQVAGVLAACDKACVGLFKHVTPRVRACDARLRISNLRFSLVTGPSSAAKVVMISGRRGGALIDRHATYRAAQAHWSVRCQA